MKLIGNTLNGTYFADILRLAASNSCCEQEVPNVFVRSTVTSTFPANVILTGTVKVIEPLPGEVPRSGRAPSFTRLSESPLCRTAVSASETASRFPGRVAD